MPDLSSLIQILNLRSGIWIALFMASCAIVFGPEIGLEFLSGLDELYIAWAKIGIAIFGSLSLVAVLTAIWQGLKLAYRPLQRHIHRRKEQQRARDVLDDLTAAETEILAYLWTRGERHFQADINGDRAATLVGRGIIRRAVRPGYTAHVLSVPYSVDALVWEAMGERPHDFHHPDPNGRPPYRSGYF
jgi:hypothetical protein